VRNHKKVFESDCNNHSGISQKLQNLSNIIISRLGQYIDEIIGDHQCGFRCNRSTTDQMFCIRQVLEKNESTMRECISYS
jgi:hypothetical protein